MSEENLVPPVWKRVGVGSRARLGSAVVSACGAVLIWSSNALAGGSALQRLTVTQVLALEFGAAFAVLACWRLLTRRRLTRPAGSPRRTPSAGAVALGAVGIAGTLALQYVAFATAPLLAANAIAYAWPLMVAAVTAVSRRSSAGPRPLLLAIIGFGGVILILVQGHGANSGAPAPLFGYLAALGSAIAMASYTLGAGRVAADTSDLSLLGTGTGAAVAIPLAVLQGAPWTPVWALGLSVFVGVGPIAVGYAMWTRAMADPNGARLAPIAYATPLLSTLLLFLSGQHLQPLGMLGCSMIVLCAIGVVIPSRAAKPQLSRRPPNPAGRGRQDSRLRAPKGYARPRDITDNHTSGLQADRSR